MAWRVLLALHSCSATQSNVGVWDVESWQTAGSSFGSYGAYDPEDSGEKHRYYAHRDERIHPHSGHGEVPLDAKAFSVPFERACMDACDQDSRCECAAYKPMVRSCQRWKGCRRHPESFVKDSETSMLMKVPSSRPKYKEYRSYNTYETVGSKDIDRGDEPAIVRSYRECQDRCTVDSQCDCSVWAIDGTDRCWKRKGCTEGTLVYDPVYTVFVKQGIFTTEDETTTEQVDPYLFVPEETSPPTTTKAATTTPSTAAPTTASSTTRATSKKVTEATSTSSAAVAPTQSTTAAAKMVYTPAATLAPATPAPATPAPAAVATPATTMPETTVTVTTTTTSPPAVMMQVAMTVPFPAEMGAASSMRNKQLRQSRAEAVEELNAELQEKRPLSYATSLAAAAALQVKAEQVELTRITGEAVDDALKVSLTAKVAGMASCSDQPETRATFLKKFAFSMATIPPERLKSIRELGSSLQQPLAQVTDLKCSAESESTGFAGIPLIGQIQNLAWGRHTVVILAVILCIALLCCLCSFFGPRGYQRVTAAPDTRTVKQGAVRPPRFESRSARIERVKSRVEKYSQRALDLVMAAEPDFEDTELLYYVKILNRCRGHAKGLCGSPWGQWHSPGDCELCKRRIDRPEKGLQCTQGGHRLCWRCMTSIMNWESLASQEGQNSWTWAHKDWL